MERLKICWVATPRCPFWICIQRRGYTSGWMGLTSVHQMSNKRLGAIRIWRSFSCRYHVGGKGSQRERNRERSDDVNGAHTRVLLSQQVTRGNPSYGVTGGSHRESESGQGGSHAAARGGIRQHGCQNCKK